MTEFTRLVSAAVFEDSISYAGLYDGSVLGETYKNVALFESTHREVRSSFRMEASRRLEHGDPDLESALEFLGLSLDLTTNPRFGFAP